MNKSIMNRLLREYDEMDSIESKLTPVSSEHTPEEFEAGQSALSHLKAALADLEMADQSKAGNYGDWGLYISKVQELISTDNGAAGLEPFVSSLLPG